jgi:hypothetical protein
MAAVQAVIVENTSQQILRILYTTATDVGFTVSGSTISGTSGGELQLGPSKRVTIESDRVNLGQLANFESKNLIRVTRTILSST